MGANVAKFLAVWRLVVEVLAEDRVPAFHLLIVSQKIPFLIHFALFVDQKEISNAAIVDVKNFFGGNLDNLYFPLS